MNLLKASFEGKVGEVYGAKWKGTNVVKAIPFSHAPHSETQTKAVRAFECVNRVAGGIAKYFWSYLNLSDKKMLKHNAVASWLKPLLADKTFNLSAITELVTDYGDAEIQAFTVNRSTGAFGVECAFSAAPLDVSDTVGAVLLVDEYGKIIFGTDFVTSSFAKTGVARLNTAYQYYAILLRADKIGTKWQANSFQLLEATYQD